MPEDAKKPPPPPPQGELYITFDMCQTFESCSVCLPRTKKSCVCDSMCLYKNESNHAANFGPYHVRRMPKRTRVSIRLVRSGSLRRLNSIHHIPIHRLLDDMEELGSATHTHKNSFTHACSSLSSLYTQPDIGHPYFRSARKDGLDDNSADNDDYEKSTDAAAGLPPRRPKRRPSRSSAVSSNPSEISLTAERKDVIPSYTAPEANLANRDSFAFKKGEPSARAIASPDFSASLDKWVEGASELKEGD
eukprot:7166947-Pyramimonas_sp.AAC.1